MPKRLVLAALSLALLPQLAFAQTSLPVGGAPLPYARPDAEKASPFDRITGKSLATGSASAIDREIERGQLGKLRSGLEALADRDLDRVRTIRDAMPEQSLDRRILAWAVAMDGGSRVPSGEIAAAAQALPGWPALESLRRNSERALYRENPAPQTVVEVFGSSEPQTIEGAIVLARAHKALGDTEAARRALAKVWREQRLDTRDEAAVIREFGSLIPVADHRERMEQMLFRERVSSAGRVAKLARAEALHKAWAAVLRREKTAAKLLDAVPVSQRSSGYLYAKAKHLRWAGKYRQAAQVVLSKPSDDMPADPDAWWVERRVLSRELLDIKDAKAAYEVAAAHSAQSPAMAADAEFHAGWYALRGLKDPTTAARHFAKIAQVADGPISQSRAHYWLGRAADAGGPGDAQSHYRKAASYGTAFYGQIAAAKLGLDAIPAAYPEPSLDDRARFERREVVQAIRRLEQAGHQGWADRLYRDLAAELDSAGELALLAVMAEERGDHTLALRVGKIAAGRGLEIGALAHPTGAIPDSANISGAGEALAYAVARQESEFNATAVSHAGAYGLLQLLPGTARDMAKKTGLPYSKARLTGDAGYNAALGAAYLGEQLDRFSGSYVLTFIGYNAGPGRAIEWVKRYGDPRGKDLDVVVDWIERIPFTETRNYVQRVMENYQVYKMRLSGRFDIAGDLVEGR